MIDSEMMPERTTRYPGEFPASTPSRCWVEELKSAYKQHIFVHAYYEITRDISTRVRTF